MRSDAFGARESLETGSGEAVVYRLSALRDSGIAPGLDRLPFSIRVLLEAVLRNVRRRDRDRGRREAPGVLERGRGGRRRAAVHARPRHPAGLHRRPGGRRPRRDARGSEATGRRPDADQPARARRPGDRPLGPGRRLRVDTDACREQRHDRVRAQPRAVRVPAVGAEGLPELPRRAAGDGHRPPGEPRVPGQRRPPAGAGRRAGRDARHPRRHRLPHDDDQRPRRPRLGRRRHRGRGGDARPAALHAHPAGRRLPSSPAKLPRGRHGDRPRPHRDADAAQARRRRQVRRVLRPRPRRDDRWPTARRSPTCRPSTARRCGFFPVDDADARVPAPHRPPPGRGRPRRALLQGAGPLPHGRDPGPRVHGHARPRPLDGRAEPRRPEAAAGPRAALADEGGVPQVAAAAPVKERGFGLAEKDTARTVPLDGLGCTGDDRPRRGRHRRDHELHQHLATRR